MDKRSPDESGFRLDKPELNIRGGYKSVFARSSYKSVRPELVEGSNERKKAFFANPRRYGSIPTSRDFVPFYGTQHFCERLELAL
jgi:hypothetical protein